MAFSTSEVANIITCSSGSESDNDFFDDDFTSLESESGKIYKMTLLALKLIMLVSTL